MTMGFCASSSTSNLVKQTVYLLISQSAFPVEYFMTFWIHFVLYILVRPLVRIFDQAAVFMWANRFSFTGSRVSHQRKHSNCLAVHHQLCHSSCTRTAFKTVTIYCLGWSAVIIVIICERVNWWRYTLFWIEKWKLFIISVYSCSSDRNSRYCIHCSKCTHRWTRVIHHRTIASCQHDTLAWEDAEHPIRSRRITTSPFGARGVKKLASPHRRQRVSLQGPRSSVRFDFSTLFHSCIIYWLLICSFMLVCFWCLTAQVPTCEHAQTACRGRSTFWRGNWTVVELFQPCDSPHSRSIAIPPSFVDCASRSDVQLPLIFQHRWYEFSHACSLLWPFNFWARLLADYLCILLFMFIWQFFIKVCHFQVSLWEGSTMHWTTSKVFLVRPCPSHFQQVGSWIFVDLTDANWSTLVRVSQCYSNFGN